MEPQDFGPNVPHSPNAGEREFEIGKDEAFSSGMFNAFMTWFGNVKRTYDEYQQESLETIRHQRQAFDKLVSDAQSHDNTIRQLSVQALQNAVTTSDMVGKQAVDHMAHGHNKNWNLNETDNAAAQVARQAEEHVVGAPHGHPGLE